MASSSDSARIRPSDRLLTDCHGGGLPLEWYTAHDDVMGGGSRGALETADGALVFTGALDLESGGFASVRTRPAPLGLEGMHGLRVLARGDARTFQLRLYPQGLTNHLRVSYRARFRPGSETDWEWIDLPFAGFQPTWRGHILDEPPLDLVRIEALGLMLADGSDAPFRLEVAAIAARRGTT